MKTQKGFTIVELLIAIVVISILASVTVVAFNGVRQRAEDTRLVAAITSYKKALALYKGDNSAYPVITTECLGVEGDLPATARFNTNECSFNQYDSIRDNTLNAALAKYMRNPPNANFLDELGTDDGNNVRGIFYQGDATYYYYEYYINPNRNCPIGRSSSFDSGFKLCYEMVY